MKLSEYLKLSAKERLKIINRLAKGKRNIERQLENLLCPTPEQLKEAELKNSLK